MSEPGPVGQPAAPSSVTALVEALDTRARQAGTESAANLLRGMLGSVSEVLAGIEDRLERVEGIVTDGGGVKALVASVQDGLSSFNGRLGRLEEAFVQAVDDGGSSTVVAEISQAVSGMLPDVPDLLGRALQPLLERLERLEMRPAPPAPPEPEPVDLTPVTARIEAVERLIRERHDADDAGAVVRAALAPIVDRLDALDRKVGEVSADNTRTRSQLEAGLAAIPVKLSTLTEHVAALDARVGPREAPIDPELLERIEARLESASRDDSSARVVALVEERMSAAVQALGQRTDGVVAAVDELGRRDSPDAGRIEGMAADLQTLTARVGEVSKQGEASAEAGATKAIGALEGRLSSLGDRLGGLEARMATLVSAVERQTEQLVGQLAAQLAVEPDRSDEERLLAALRSESELLTQRVAALAVGVEATRTLLQQHVEDTEQSVGRKAGEFGRRLAADFGLKTRDREHPGRRDPRELNP